jgi:hypothetical protein
MNKYEPEKTDLDISEDAVYCALAVVAAFLALGGLLFFHKEILSFIGFIIFALFSGVVYVVSTVFQVTKPINESFGVYISLGLLAISMWAFCVFHKIYDWFEDAKKKWLFVHRFFYYSFIVSMMFVAYLNFLIKNPSHSEIYLIFFFFCTLVFKIHVAMDNQPQSSWTKEYVEDMKNRVRNSKK